MTAADIELARMAYLVASLGALLFTSILLRGLWRPLRMLALTAVFSLLFTPFFVPQKMPDGSEQNIVPAFVVMLHDAANDREQWREGIKRAGTPMAVVGGITGLLALVLLFLLPKPVKPPRPEKTATTPPAKTGKKSKTNPYLPDDFQPG